jgi:hypothetical protein
MSDFSFDRPDFHHLEALVSEQQGDFHRFLAALRTDVREVQVQPWQMFLRSQLSEREEYQCDRGSDETHISETEGRLHVIQRADRSVHQSALARRGVEIVRLQEPGPAAAL